MVTVEVTTTGEMFDTPAVPMATSELASSPITSSQRWQHTYGEMLIETRANGTVWIDGKLVRDTAPGAFTSEEGKSHGRAD